MNVLAVGAHYDDVELGCGGSLAKHVIDGDKVYIYVATTSGGTNPFGEVIRESEESKLDGQKAACILGAELLMGNFQCNHLIFDDNLNCELIKIIEENGIDLLYTHWRHDAHHDHAELARASLHAGRHLNNILMYRSNWYQSDNVFYGNFFRNISCTWEIKEKALQCYEKEMKRTNGEWIVFKKNEAINNGKMIGVEYAEIFQCVKWCI